MELKLTTLRALEYEERTGEDIVMFLQKVAETSKITVKNVVDLFIAMGQGYTAEMFDEWDEPFVVKAEKIINACKDYIQGKKSKK